MRPTRLLIVFITALVLAACAAPMRPYPVSGEFAQTQVQPGLFEITPPQGANWYALQRQPGLLAYGKKLESADHTFIALVRASEVDRSFASEDEFVAFIRQERARDAGPERFVVRFHDDAIDRSRPTFCARFHLQAEDKVASRAIGKTAILEVAGLSCLHPNRRVVVTVDYSERGVAPFRDAALIAEGEALIASLRFK